MIEVSLQEAYDVACRKIGDLTVRNELLEAEISRLTAESKEVD